MVSRALPDDLETKVRRLFAVVVYGSRADEPDERNTRAYDGARTPAEVVAQQRVGGVVYFRWADNLDDPLAVAELSRGLQAARPDGAPPLIVGIDQESGAVLRLTEPVTQFAGNAALGAAGDPELTRRASAVTGAELRALGVTLDFAPCADVLTEPDSTVIGVRAFGDDPDVVALHVAAAVGGLHDGGVGACAKHFPGHGGTAADSHVELPDVTRGLDEWHRLDAVPFAAAVEAGVDAVMTAHITARRLDPDGAVATLSAPVLTGLLRGELGFDGVIATDSLAMAGVRGTAEPRPTAVDPEVAVRALEAGSDLLVVPMGLTGAVEGVVGAVRSGRIPESRIDESLARLERLARAYDGEPRADPATVLGTPAHRDVAREVAERAVTVLRGGSSLPVAPGARVVVAGPRAAAEALAAELRTGPAAGGGVDVVDTGPAGRASDPAAVVRAARDHDVAVVLTSRANRVDVDPDRTQLALVTALSGAGVEVLGVATRDPDDDLAVPEVAAGTYLGTFSDGPDPMAAAARVLDGRAVATGTRPYALPTRATQAC